MHADNSFKSRPRRTGLQTQDFGELLKRYTAGERDFGGVDLRGAYLSEAILSGADFRQADLSRANLRRRVGN
jgi:Uncharacterized low-complexity proteins